jgi:cholesterol oxidase
MSAVTYRLQFTEEMKGFFAFGEADFQRGFDDGRRQGGGIMFHLTIATEDVYRFIEDPRHLASTSGWVKSEVLGGRLPVEKGTFNLFVDDGPARKRMLYRLFFRDGVDRPLTLTGFKDVHHDPVTHVWPETSTLYTRVFRGHVEEEGEATADVVGSGILHILPLDFARQLTTFRTAGPGLGGRLSALGAFGKLFVGELWEVFRPSRWVTDRA